MENSSENSDQTAEQPSSSTQPQQEDEIRTSILDLVKLRRLRKSLRLTQAELAALLGIHRTYLVLIEKGKKIPSPRLERQILDFMEKAENQGLSPQSLWDASRQPQSWSFQHGPACGQENAGGELGCCRGGSGLRNMANQIEETVETDCKDPNAFRDHY